MLSPDCATHQERPHRLPAPIALLIRWDLRDGILNVAFLPRETAGLPRTSASAVAGVAGAASMPPDFGGGGGGGSPSEGSSGPSRSAFHGGAASLQVQVRP